MAIATGGCVELDEGDLLFAREPRVQFLQAAREQAPYDRAGA